MKRFVFFTIALSLLYCRQGPIDYEANTKIVRVEIVNKDEEGKPAVIDVEIKYPDCPGMQLEIIRGGKDFAECILANYKLEDKMVSKVHWHWDNRGFYKWEVQKIGNCERPFDLEDEVSYEMVEECEDYIVYGRKVGFRCHRIPTAGLLKACPWFRRK